MPSLSTYPIFWSVYFGTTSHMSDTWSNSWSGNNVYVDKFIKSYIAGSIGSTVTNPLYVIKTRAQNVDRPMSLVSTIQGLNKIGYRSYFKGLTSCYYSNLKLGLQFPLYDFIKAKTDNVVVSGISSKMLSSIALYPLDVVRTNQRNTDVSMSMMRTAVNVVKQNGIKGLYRGSLVYVVSSAPNFAIMMTMMEWLNPRV
jgi:hypothetical protein